MSDDLEIPPGGFAEDDDIEDVAAPEPASTQEEPPGGFDLEPEPEPLQTDEHVEGQRDAHLRELFQAGGHQDGNRWAGILGLREKTGLPFESLERNYDMFARTVESSGRDPRRWRRDNPGLYSWITEDPKRAPLALKEEKVSWFTKAMRWYRASQEANDLTVPEDVHYTQKWDWYKKHAAEAAQKRDKAFDPRMTLQQENKARGVDMYADVWKRARKQSERSSLGRNQFALDLWQNVMESTGSPEDIETARVAAYENRKRIEGIDEEIGTQQDYGQGAWEQFGIDVLEGGASQVDSLIASGVGATGGAVVGGVIGAAGGAFAGGVGAIPGAVAGAQVGAPIGIKLLSFASSFDKEAGGFYLEALDMKDEEGHRLPQSVAMAGAMVYGLAAAGVELASVGPMLKAFGPLGEAVASGRGAAWMRKALADRKLRGVLQSIGTDLGKSVLSEGGEEMAQTTLDHLTKWASSTVLPGEQKFDTDRWLEETVESGYKGVVGALGMGGAQMTVSVAQEAIRWESSLEGGAKLAAIAGLAESEMARHAPKELARFVELETKRTGSPVKTLFVDPVRLTEAVTREGGDPEAAVRALMGEQGPARVRQAMQERVDEPGSRATLEVPVEEYLERWGNKPIAETLFQDMTTTRGNFTSREVAQLPNDVDALAKKLVDAELSEAKDMPAPGIYEQQYVAAAMKQMTETGRLSDTEAKTSIATTRALIRTMYARVPGAAESVFRQQTMRIQGTRDLVVGPPVASRQLTERLRRMDRKSAAGRKARAELAFVDNNTGIYSERGFRAQEVDAARPLIARYKIEGTKWRNKVGHSAGNELYRLAGQVLKGLVEDAAKWGGDFISSAANDAEAQDIAARLKAGMRDRLRQLNPELADQIEGLEVIATTAARGDNLDAAVEATNASGIVEATRLEKEQKRALRGEKPFGIPVEDAALLKMPGEEVVPRALPEALLKQAGEMTDEQLFNEVYVDKKTGLLSREGFFALPAKKHVISMDLNGLKKINAALGEAAGDAMLAAFARVARLAGAAGMDMAHLSGDEYAAQTDDPELAQYFIDILAELAESVEHEAVEGVPEGITFGYGIGENYDAADGLIEGHKLRERANPGTERSARAQRAADRGSDGIARGRERLARGDRAQVYAGVRGRVRGRSAEARSRADAAAQQALYEVRLAALSDPARVAELLRQTTVERTQETETAVSMAVQRLLPLPPPAFRSKDNAWKTMLAASPLGEDGSPTQEADYKYVRALNGAGVMPGPWTEKSGFFDEINKELGLKGMEQVRGARHAFDVLTARQNVRTWEGIERNVLPLLRTVPGLENLQMPQEYIDAQVEQEARAAEMERQTEADEATSFDVDRLDATFYEPAFNEEERLEQPSPRVVNAVMRNLTEEERARVNTKAVEKIVDLLTHLPSAKEMAAVAVAGRAKRGWYQQSAEALSIVFGPDAPRFAMLLAALSPQTSVEINLQNAMGVWREWLKAGRPTNKKAILACMGRGVTGDKGIGSVLHSWRGNSYRALTAEEPGKARLSGPKVDSFYRNLIGQTEEVTNDAWMAAYAGVKQSLFAGNINVTGEDPGKRPGYLAMSVRVRQAAAELTKISGEAWSPAEVQETVWSWAKTIYEMREARGEKRSAVELVKDKAVTHELINSTPDFSSLFFNDLYAGILEEAGYGTKLEELRRSNARVAEEARAQPGAPGEAEPFAERPRQRYLTSAARRLDELAERRALEKDAKKAAAEEEVEVVLNQDGPVENTRAFKRWFKNSKAVDSEGKPLELLHGTTADWTEFDIDRTNPESDMGRGFYSSNTPDDVGNNYAGEGPDLTSRLEQEYERITSDENVYNLETQLQGLRNELEELEDDADDFDAKVEEIRELEQEIDNVKNAAWALARERLGVQHGGATMKVYLSLQNPVVIGGDNETMLTYDSGFDPETDEYGKPSGTLADFMQNLRNVADSYQDGGVDSLINSLYEQGLDGGMNVGDIFRLAKADEFFGYFTDDEGRFVPNEILRQAFELTGFDGYIDHTVDMKFGSQRRIGRGMRGMNEETVHYIAWRPEQIKSATGNAGTFDPSEPDILKQDGDEGPVWYSAALRAVRDAKQQKNTAQAWYSVISKAPGVKLEELEWMGLKEWLDEQEGSLTREQVSEYVEAHGLEVQTESGVSSDAMDTVERAFDDIGSYWNSYSDSVSYRTEYGDHEMFEFDDNTDFDRIRREQRETEEALSEAQSELSSKESELEEKRESMRYDELDDEQSDALQAEIDTLEREVQELEETRDEKQGDANSLIPDDTLSEAEGMIDDERARREDAESYAEQAMSALRRGDVKAAEQFARDASSSAGDTRSGNRAIDTFQNAIDEFNEGAAQYEDYTLGGHVEGSYKEVRFYARGTSADKYSSPHFGGGVEEGLLAHARVTEHLTPEGKKVLFVEEVQSDLHQEGREKGYEQRDPLMRERRGNRKQELLRKYVVDETYGVARHSSFDEARDTLFGVLYRQGGDVQRAVGIAKGVLEAGLPRYIERSKNYSTPTTQRAWVDAAKEALDEMTPEVLEETAEEARELQALQDYAGPERRQTSYVVRPGPFTNRSNEWLEAVRVENPGLAERFDRSVREGLRVTPEEYAILEKVSTALHTEQYRTEAGPGQLSRRVGETKRRTPDAPFKTSWEELVVKRMVRWAAENGYDTIGWTTGNQQAERYGKQLAQVVDKVWWASNTMTSWPLGPGERRVGGAKNDKDAFIVTVAPDGKVLLSNHSGIPAGVQLSEVIGADMAAKAMESPQGSVNSEEFVVGRSSGMHTAYDKRIPGIFAKLVKKSGGKVQPLALQSLLEKAKDAVAPHIDAAIADRSRLMRDATSSYDQAYQTATSEEAKKAEVEKYNARIAEIERWYNEAVISKETPEEAAKRQRDASSVWSVTIPESLREQVLREGMPLFQDEEQKTPRGYIEITKNGVERAYRIFLTEKSDRSTVLHEQAHMYLEMLGDLAQHPEAAAQLKVHYQAVLNWLGAPNRRMLTEAQKEQWARGFEAYLMEGNAPSDALVGPFETYRLWLSQIYKTTGDLKVELNDGIREVFDSMLASDAEIERMKDAAGLGRPMWKTPAEAGMTAEEWRVYREEQIKTTTHTAMAARARTAAARQKAQEAFRSDEFRQLKTQADREWYDRRDVRAWRHLRMGESVLDDGQVIRNTNHGKLHTETVTKLLGDDHPLLTSLRGRLSENGQHPSEVAEQFGFTSGLELLQAVAAMPERKQFVEQRAQELYKEKHPDLDASINELATQKNLHGENTAKWLLKELAVIGQRSVTVYNPETDEPAKIPQSLLTPGIAQAEVADAGARKAAEDLVSARAIGKLNPGNILASERGAANQALVAAAKGNFLQARELKLKQILMHHTWRELEAAVEEREVFLKMAKELSQDGARERLGKANPAYRDVVDTLLENAGFAEARVQDVPRAGLEALIELMQKNGDTITMDLDFVALMMAKPVPWRELTVAQMRQLAGAIKNIRKGAINQNQVLIDGKAVDKDEAKGHLLEEAVKNLAEQPPIASSRAAMTSAQRAQSLVNAFDGYLLKPQTMIGWLGGENIDSWWHRAIVKPLQEAKAREADLLRDVVRPLTEAFENIPPEMRRRLMERIDGKKLFPEHTAKLPAPTLRVELIMLLLNRGNASNLERLTGGRNITAQEIDAAATLLTREELAWVQQVWDSAESLWPLSRDLEERDSGLAPPKIQATPFAVKLADGSTYQMKGGYFPAAYDSRVSSVGLVQANDSVFDTTYVRPGTSRSHLNKRADRFADVISLDPATIQGHLLKVTHDIAFREPLRSVANLIFDKDIKAAMYQRLGKERADTLVQWLKDVGKMEGAQVDAHAGPVARTIRAFRNNMVIGTLGYAVDNFVGDFTNLLVAPLGSKLKAKHLGAGMYELAKDWGKMRSWAMQNSGELRRRSDNIRIDFDRQIKSMTKSGNVAARALQWYRDHAFWVAEQIDIATSTPIWLGAYRQAEAERPGDHAYAVEFANVVLQQTLPSSSVVDMSAIQRDKGFIGASVAFYGYMNVLYNLDRRIMNPVFDARGMRSKASALRKAIGPYFAMMVASRVFAEFLIGRGPEPDDEEGGVEGWLQWFMRKLLVGTMSGAPFIGGMVEGLALGREPSGRAAPGFQVWYDAGKAAQKVWREGGDGVKEAFGLLKALGLLSGIPTRPLRPVQAALQKRPQGEQPATSASRAVYGSRKAMPVTPVDLLTRKGQKLY